MVFEKLFFWLKGKFVCRKCGKNLCAFFFGFGEAICPDCYDGEPEFIFLDTSYWLNRIISPLIRGKIQITKTTKKAIPSEKLVHG